MFSDAIMSVKGGIKLLLVVFQCYVVLVQTLPVDESKWSTLLTQFQDAETTAISAQRGFFNVTFSCAAALPRSKFIVKLLDDNGKIIRELQGSGVGSATLSFPPCDVCKFQWTAFYEECGWSPLRGVIAAPSKLTSSPIWAADNSTGGGPQFVFMKASIPQGEEDSISSALLFLTADGPVRHGFKGDSTVFAVSLTL